MTRQSHDRLHQAGRRVVAARRHLGMTRAALARAAGVSDRSIARLEAGEDVRLSTYLAVLDGLAAQAPSVAGLAERIAGLPDRGRTLVLELVAQVERINPR